MALEWIPDFLSQLAKSPNVSGACRAAGISREAVYKYRDSDPDFAAAWDDALNQSTDALVGEIYRRAVEGTEEPVYYRGEECGRIRKYSDTLAIFLAKCHRPEVYGDRTKIELTGMSDEELIQRTKAILAGSGEAGPDAG